MQSLPSGVISPSKHSGIACAMKHYGFAGEMTFQLMPPVHCVYPLLFSVSKESVL